jgi:galactonate dehydratase
MPSADANTPAPLGTSTIAADISQQEATYLQPDDLVKKYEKGIQRYIPGEPDKTFTQAKDGSKNPHLIKKVDR